MREADKAVEILHPESKPARAIIAVLGEVRGVEAEISSLITIGEASDLVSTLAREVGELRGRVEQLERLLNTRSPDM